MHKQSVDLKFEHPFIFRNYAKLIFSAIEIAKSDDKTDALYKSDDKQFKDRAEDTKLIERLTAPKELNGLLDLVLSAKSCTQNSEELTSLID